MTKPRLLIVATAGLLLLGTAVVIWRRDSAPLPPVARHDQSTTKASVESPASGPPDVASAAASAREAAAAAMLDTLQRALARGDVREQEAVLSFQDADALRRFLGRAERSGLPVLGVMESLRAVRVRLDTLEGLRRDLLGHGEDYAGVEANALIGIPRPPPREDRAAMQHVPFGNETLAFLGASGDRSTWGRGATIAILDTGVAPDPTFGSRLRGIDIGLGLVPGAGGSDGHGTAIAALAAGASADAAGLAPAASLLSIRVTDTSGVSDLFTLAQGIVAAVDAGARIVNISLGGYSTGAALNAALGYASAHGAVVVAAAGNDQAARLAWPAADPCVVSVGAIDRAEQQVSFSNSGPQLQLTAPGYGVQTAWLDGRRVTMDGTSASAPLVAGAIAAVISQQPHLTATQAAELLARTASDGGAPGADAAFGRGILNVGWAMNSGNLNYVDTAIASHHFDAAKNQMEFVVQNRSGRAVSGLSLAISGGGQPATTQIVPSLSPGESYVARIPVDVAALERTGSVRYFTQLGNPAGVDDRVPENNRRASTLSAPSR